jgi:hypothetical protein
MLRPLLKIEKKYGGVLSNEIKGLQVTREKPRTTLRPFTAARNAIRKGAITQKWLSTIELGLPLILTVFVFLQGWAIHRIVMVLVARPLADGKLYLTQALHLQNEPFTILRFLEFGLYPLFLSQFDVGMRDWLSDGNDPKFLPVYYTQSLILCAASAVFLFCAFIYISGRLFTRIVVSMLLGCILLSPLVIVWPINILTEALALPTILLVACACLADDSGRHWSPIFIAIVCSLLVLVRDAMMIFVCIFGALLLANSLFVKINWTAARMIGMVLVLVAIGLGVAKASLVTSGGSKNVSQLLANIIQFRILPDPERRQFFVERGLPISSTVMERSGKPAWVNDDWYAPDSVLSAEFVAYRRWIEAKGIRTYLIFLLAHPRYLLRSIVYNPTLPDEHYRVMQDVQFSITDLFSRPFTGGYQTFFTPYPKWLRNFLLAPFGWFFPSLYLVLVAIRYIYQTASQQRASSLDVAAIAAAGAVFVNYHVDAWGIWPHTVPFVLLIYIALITGTAKVGNELLRRFVSGLPTDADVIAFKDANSISKSESSSLLSTGTRWNLVRIFAGFFFAFSFLLVGHNYLVGGMKTAGSAMKFRKVTDINELPAIPESSSAQNRWDLIWGLDAEVVEGSAVVSGHALRLVAVGVDRRHALGVRSGDLAPNGVYRTTAWVKAAPGVRIMIEARDSFDPNTGKPANYGVAQFDLSTRSLVNSSGDIIASGVEAAADDWAKVWVDLRSRDGRIFALIGLLEGRNNLHVFTAAGQSVIFGGFEIAAR